MRTSSSAFSKVTVRRPSPDFLHGAASLAPGKLEDCAVHQAARSAAWRGAASRSLRKLDEAHIACTHRGGLAGTSTLSLLLNGGSRSQGQAPLWSPPGRAVHTVHHTLILMPHQTSPRSRFRTRTRHGPVPGARDPRDDARITQTHTAHTSHAPITPKQ